MKLSQLEDSHSNAFVDHASSFENKSATNSSSIWIAKNITIQKFVTF
jgi:hypothetical protein